MATTTLKATCLCTSSSHTLTLSSSSLPLPLTLCHCTSCRHTFGTLCLTTAVLPSSYIPSPSLVAKLKPYRFFYRITDYACATCGTHMLFYVKHPGGQPEGEGYWAVHSGTLTFEEHRRDGSMLMPDVHWFVGDTKDGGFADFMPRFREKEIPRYAGFKGKSEFLPPGWTSAAEDPIPASQSPETLHCHCRCGGVELWIGRPSGDLKKTCDHPSSNDKFPASVCSCTSCRLYAGMEWMEWVFVPTINITLDAEGNVPLSLPFGTLKGYQSSAGVTRYRCHTCGCPAFYGSADQPDLIRLAVGLMDAPEGARAESWLEWSTKRFDAGAGPPPRAAELAEEVDRGLAEYERNAVEL